MYKKLLLVLLFPFILSACGSDEPLDLFHLTLGTEADADIVMATHSADKWLSTMDRGRYRGGF